MYTTWQLNTLFGISGMNDPIFQIEVDEYAALSREFYSKYFVDRSYLENGDRLFEALESYLVIAEKLSKHKSLDYLHLAHSIDLNNSAIKELEGKLDDKYNEIDTQYMQFFKLSLGKIEVSMQTAILTDDKFAKYHKLLRDIWKESKYNLSDPEEKIFTLLSAPTSQNWYNLNSETLAKQKQVIKLPDGTEKTCTLNELTSITTSTDSIVRAAGAQAINIMLANNLDIATAELNSIYKTKQVSDNLRGIARPDLTRHLSDDMESEIVDLMIQTVTENFDIPAKYYELKAKSMGLEKLQYWDINVPIDLPEKKYSFEEAFNICKDVVSKVDPAFGDIYNEFLAKGQFDIYPRENKRHGAFCSDSSPTNPVFVLLNHSGELQDVYTLAHEMGHALNAVYMGKSNQNILYYGYGMAIAEVASTFFEELLDHHMQSGLSEYTQGLLFNKLNDSVSTIFRQVACYNLEQDLHKQVRELGYLGKEKIGSIFLKHMSSYMGDFVAQNEGSENWWVYWSHLRYNFYVYSYASGLLISKALQNMYRHGDLSPVQIIEFLSSDSSLSPREIFARIGIDIADKNFWMNGIEGIRNDLKELESMLAE